MAPERLAPEEVRLLAGMGFVASGAGLTIQARQIFESLARLRPDRAFPYVGLATLHLNRGDAAGAVAVIEDGRRMLESAGAGRAAAPSQQPSPTDAADPRREDRSMLCAWHGITLNAARHASASEQALREAMAIDPQGPGGRLAARMLGLP